jgi:hypothetical protein
MIERFIAWLRARRTAPAPTSPWRQVAPGLLERPYTLEDAERDESRREARWLARSTGSRGYTIRAPRP